MIPDAVKIVWAARLWEFIHITLPLILAIGILTWLVTWYSGKRGEGLIFVFGSNLSGVHGAGSAKVARLSYGAVLGVGEGRTGRAYAIPTKEANVIDARNLDDIDNSVLTFCEYAKAHPELEFQVTRIGCGHAGFTDSDIAPMFQETPSNCLFDSAWERWLPGRRFWGTF